MSKVDCALRIAAILGEGPLWRASEKKLYWLDLFAPAVHRFDPATGRNEKLEAELGAAIGGMVFDRAGNWVIVDREGVHRIDPKQGKRKRLAASPELKSGMTFNDAKCDRRGRLWTGSGDVDWVKPVGEFYMMDGAGKLTSLDKPIACSNGPAFSPDGSRAYYTDGNARHIVVYDIDRSTGAVGGRRPFYSFQNETEGPDGMTVDADGCLWVALWGDGHIAQLTPNGKLERKLKVPVPQPTSVGFGGDRLEKMYITSARVGLGDQQLRDAPLSGSIFVAEVGAKGLPEPDFIG